MNNNFSQIYTTQVATLKMHLTLCFAFHLKSIRGGAFSLCRGFNFCKMIDRSLQLRKPDLIESDGKPARCWLAGCRDYNKMIMPPHRCGVQNQRNKSKSKVVRSCGHDPPLSAHSASNARTATFAGCVLVEYMVYTGRLAAHNVWHIILRRAKSPPN